MSNETIALSKFKLLIHHHAVVYRDKYQTLWLPSFIGRWVDALADYFGQVGLLMHESIEQMTGQDEQISRSNVKLFSLGPPGQMWDRLQRISRIKATCRRAAQEADGLLIRGITPRQHIVWKCTNLSYQAFLLVGSISQPHPPQIKISITDLYRNYMVYHRRWELKKMAQSTLMLVNSPALINEVEQELNKKAFFVPTNSIRVSEIPALHYHPLSQPIRLLFCGRVVVEKGIIDLLQSIGILKDRGINCTLDIVGPVSDTMQFQIQVLSKELGIDYHINLHGAIPYGSQLFKFYREADLFVLPSFSEGFPHVIWEAAANGCPVVTTSVGGIPALWKDRIHGLLVSPHKPDLLAQAIQQVIFDDDLRRTLINRAYNYAQEFTVEACAERLATMLSEKWKIQ